MNAAQTAMLALRAMDRDLGMDYADPCGEHEPVCTCTICVHRRCNHEDKMPLHCYPDIARAAYRLPAPGSVLHQLPPRDPAMEFADQIDARAAALIAFDRREQAEAVKRGRMWFMLFALGAATLLAGICVWERS